jgi:hypothetical protein
MTHEEATTLSKEIKDARQKYNNILDGWSSGIVDFDQLEQIKADLDTAHERILAVLCAHQNHL